MTPTPPDPIPNARVKPEPAGLPRRAALRRIGHATLAAVAAGAGAGVGPGCAVIRRDHLRIACFEADITVPIGHGMMGGAWRAKSVADPLEASGFVLEGTDGGPVVFVSADWCEIRNDAYARWQEVLASAAGTSPERVILSTIHQHDAPVADLTAERVLRERGLAGTVCDPLFHEAAVQGVADALRVALRQPRRVTHVGMGRARVERLASNRRYVMPDGQVRFDRTSATRNAFAIEAEEGLIDPWLRTLSLWNQDEPIAAASFYAVHPMSYYGQGEVSADFPGLARRARERELPSVHSLYVSGCSGNVTAGKYNTGARDNRAVLAERLRHGMEAAWNATERHPLTRARFRDVPLVLEPRTDSGFAESELLVGLTTETDPFRQCLRAMGISWCRRVAAGRPIRIPCLELGDARVLLLPGETYVDYQLAAQNLRPDAFVCVAGYGDGATGYIPTERHWQEKDSNLGDWCWVAPGAEARMMEAIRRVLV